MFATLIIIDSMLDDFRCYAYRTDDYLIIIFTMPPRLRYADADDVLR